MKGQSVFIMLAVLGLVLLGAMLYSSRDSGVACTQEAMQCLDGSYVSRNPAKACAFDPCPGNYTDYSVIVNNLRKSHTVELLGDISQPFMPVEGQNFRLTLRDAQGASSGSEEFQAFEFATANTASDFASLVSQDGYVINGSAIQWTAKPHFYGYGRLIVIYIGDRDDMHAALSSIAEQFAGLDQQKHYCTPESRNAQACITLYKPVCGWFDQDVQCIKYPCAQTFSNSCHACTDDNVLYYTEGQCPA